VAFDAIILAGARSERLGGADKASVVVGGESLLERAVAAVGAAERIFVVGPRRDLGVDVLWVQDEGGGPAAAIAAGIEKVRSDITVVLAVDHPLVTESDVSRLIASMARDGAIATDDTGRRQPLVAAYVTNALVAVLARSISSNGARVRDLVSSLHLEEVDLGVSAGDCDTWDDIATVATMRR
jgi:molybdopterin-guanine dinucleotide biosynthesis protein A